jgi:hypothetical protein
VNATEKVSSPRRVDLVSRLRDEGLATEEHHFEWGITGERERALLAEWTRKHPS